MEKNRIEVVSKIMSGLAGLLHFGCFGLTISLLYCRSLRVYENPKDMRAIPTVQRGHSLQISDTTTSYVRTVNTRIKEQVD